MADHKNEQLPEQHDTIEVTLGDSLAQRTDRRELLKKIGKFGAYTAPAILILLNSEAKAFGY